MSPVSAGAIVARTFAVLRDSLLAMAFAFVSLVALGVVVDTGLAGRENEAVLNLLASAAAIFAQYRLTWLALRRLTGAPPAGGGIWQFIGLGILTGLGILAGLLLLIVPGIVLIVRWSMSTPILLSTDEGVSGAMTRSWRNTEGRFWAILLAYLALWAPGVALAIAGLILEASADNVVGTILVNIGLNWALVCGWYGAVATFSLVEAPNALGEVFD